MTEFTSKLLEVMKNIPYGRVTTYGRIAESAGNPRAARQVAWALKVYAHKYKLPWHRIINSKGIISLKMGNGFEIQKALLEEEGVFVEESGKVDLQIYLWDGDF